MPTTGQAHYNERAQSRGSVIARWMVLVPACAIPLVIPAWRTLSIQELVGISAGVATWTLLMIRLHVWRLAVGRYGETTRLTLSAMVLMAVEWLVLAAAPSIALLVIYAPSAILVGWAVPEALTKIDLLMAYLVTVVCGAQALVCVAALWWVVEQL